MGSPSAILHTPRATIQSVSAWVNSSTIYHHKIQRRDKRFFTLDGRKPPVHPSTSKHHTKTTLRSISRTEYPCKYILEIILCLIALRKPGVYTICLNVSVNPAKRSSEIKTERLATAHQIQALSDKADFAQHEYPVVHRLLYEKPSTL